jgi:7,8-dihydroneopterin aldolase/epimerase/oxygenase
MDKIIIEGASFQARVGVSEEERSRQQEIVVNLQAFIDTRVAGQQDDPDATVSYVEIHEVAARIVSAKAYRLIESLAEELAAAVLRSFAAVAGVVVRVAKPAALGDRGVRLTAVEITRMKNE